MWAIFNWTSAIVLFVQLETSMEITSTRSFVQFFFVSFKASLREHVLFPLIHKSVLCTSHGICPHAIANARGYLSPTPYILYILYTQLIQLPTRMKYKYWAETFEFNQTYAASEGECLLSTRIRDKRSECHESWHRKLSKILRYSMKMILICPSTSCLCTPN